MVRGYRTTKLNKTTSGLCTYIWWWAALHSIFAISWPRSLHTFTKAIGVLGTFIKIYESIVISHQCRIYESVINRVRIGSDDGLSPIWHQAIILSRVGLLSNGHVRTKFSEIVIKIENYSFTKMHLNILSVKWRPFCPGEMSNQSCGIVSSWNIYS